jgi:nitrite reductase/ring-hydroxylating ferredoxin subunit
VCLLTVALTGMLRHTSMLPSTVFRKQLDCNQNHNHRTDTTAITPSNAHTVHTYKNSALSARCSVVLSNRCSKDLDSECVSYACMHDLVYLALCQTRNSLSCLTCRLAPLSEGRVEKDGTLLCAYHAWRFDGTGACTVIPQAASDKKEGQANKDPRACATAYPTRVEQVRPALFHV